MDKSDKEIQEEFLIGFVDYLKRQKQKEKELKDAILEEEMNEKTRQLNIRIEDVSDILHLLNSILKSPNAKKELEEYLKIKGSIYGNQNT